VPCPLALACWGHQGGTQNQFHIFGIHLFVGEFPVGAALLHQVFEMSHNLFFLNNGAKLRKNERNAKGKLAFLSHFRVPVTSAKPKLRKNEGKTKETRFFFSRSAAAEKNLT
jgi:hypothetical protein